MNNDAPIIVEFDRKKLLPGKVGQQGYTKKAGLADLLHLRESIRKIDKNVNDYSLLILVIV